MKKDLTIYVQQWQTNGYYPTSCYKRVNGKWSHGMHKVSCGKNYFNMHESNLGDNYFWYLLRENFRVFSTEPIWSGEIMHKGNLTKEDVRRMIFED